MAATFKKKKKKKLNSIKLPTQHYIIRKIQRNTVLIFENMFLLKDFFQ